MRTIPKLKDYEFIRYLGGGAFGEVWLAHYLPLDQPRAVKLLRSEQWSEDAVERMIEEAKKMAALPKHANRVQVYSIYNGVTNCYLSMEFFDGGTLSDHASAAEPMSWERATRYVADVANGLKDVHALGILHRDIKPDNILLDTQRDEAALADFGIAASAAVAEGPAGARSFCAPEVKRGGFATPKSDVYSLAVTLFHLVVGYPPDRCEDWDNNPDLERLPSPVLRLIKSGIQPNPEDRIDLDTFESSLRHVRHAELAERLLASIARQEWETQLETALAISDASAPDAFASVEIESLKHASLGINDLVRLESCSNAEGYLHVLILNASGSLDVVVPSPSNLNNRIVAGQRHTLVFRLSPPGGMDYIILVWTRKSIRPTADKWRRWLEDIQLRSKESQASHLKPSLRNIDLVLHQSEEPPRGDWVAKVLPIRHAG